MYCEWFWLGLGSRAQSELSHFVGGAVWRRENVMPVVALDESKNGESVEEGGWGRGGVWGNGAWDGMRELE